MDKLKMETPDITVQNIEKIGELFPEAITEARGPDGQIKKAIDFETLRQLLSPDVLEGEETYEFSWVGKKASMVEAVKPIRKTLRPYVEESVNWAFTENLYIEGDNLDVLKLLQESYLGKVKLIYIDPPYNTGHDFIYPDSFIMDNDEYDDGTSYYDDDGNVNFKRENSESAGKYHSDWCSMMYSRLRLANNLLTDDGVIFISIDENEMIDLRNVCDEILGEKNFVAQITLLCNPKGRSQDKYIANCHEYIVIYSKQMLKTGSLSIPKNLEEIKKNYKLKDKKGYYRELELRNTHREFGRFNRNNLFYPFFVDKNGNVFLENNIENTDMVYPIWDDGFEGCWTWGMEKASTQLDELVAKRVNGRWKIFRKNYAKNDEGIAKKQVKSIWNEKEFFTEKGQKIFNELFDTAEKVFQSPKSVLLIMQIILMATDSDDLILDFFSGSATTAHAVMQLNGEDGGERKFIMAQLPEPCDEQSEAYKAGYKNICEIGKERIRRAGNKIKTEIEAANARVTADDEIKAIPDIGFRVLKLDETNMKDVYYSAQDYDQQMLAGLEDNIKEDRTDRDLLFGCLLSWGLPLNLPYTTETLDGCTVHTYNEGDLIACFDKKVPEGVVRAIAGRKPLRAVFRDAGFASSPEKINVEEIFKLLAPNTRVKVI